MFSWKDMKDTGYISVLTHTHRLVALICPPPARQMHSQKIANIGQPLVSER